MLAPLVLAAEISAANLSPSTAATAPIEEAATERGFGCSLSGCGTYNQYTGEWSGTNWKGEHAAGNTYTGQWHANGWEGSATGNTHTGSATLQTLPLAPAVLYTLSRAQATTQQRAGRAASPGMATLAAMSRKTTGAAPTMATLTTGPTT